MNFKSINLIGLILIIAASFVMLEDIGLFGTVDASAGASSLAGADVPKTVVIDGDADTNSDANTVKTSRMILSNGTVTQGVNTNQIPAANP